MQRLPAESLGCIFVACLPDEPYVRPARDRAPLLLVEVCRRWREVARQTPQLWRSLDAIQDHGWGELGVVNWEDMDNFETWLSRSGNRPLSLGLSFSDDANFRDDWMELVQSYRERFWRLRIVDGDRVDLNQLLDGAHMLQHLAVQALFEEGDRVVAVTQPLPRLKTLVLDLLHASPGTLRDAGWANLTRLAVRLPEVVSYEVEKFLILLDRCPNLDRLIFGPVAAGSHHPSSRSHPNLRMLAVILHSGDEDPVFNLILPNLEFLKVLYDFDGELEESLMSDEKLAPFPLYDLADSSEQETPSAVGPPGPLRSIRVVGGGQCFAMFDLCWANVEELDVHYSGGGVLSMALAACPNLRVLSLRGACEANSAGFFTPFTHPTLASLSITARAELGNFFSMATLPSLRELKVIATSYGQHDDVRTFLTRSGCSLETLWVWARGSAVWTEGEQEELMELIPTLTRLVLNA